MKKTIYLFVFLVLSISIFASSWKEYQQTPLNNLNSGISLSESLFVNTQNISNLRLNYNGVLYDYDSDGYNDIFTYSSNTLITYHYDQASQNFADVAETELVGAISEPYIYYQSATGKKILVMYNSTDIYFYQILNNGALTLDFNKKLSNTLTDRDSISPFAGATTSSASSINCVLYQSTDYCVLKENSTNIEIYNITTTTAITSNNYSISTLYDYPFNYKAPFYETNSDLIYAIFYCTSSGYGLAWVNLSNGALIKQNCTLSATQPTNNPSVLNIDGGEYEIWFTSQSGFNAGGDTIKMNSIGLGNAQKTGFPITLASGNGWASKGFGAIGGSIYNVIDNSATNTTIQKITSTGTLMTISTMPLLSSGSINQDVAFGNDFVIFSKYVYDTSQGKITSILNFSGNPVISAGASGKIILLNGGTMQTAIYTTQQAPLNYPNTTLYVRNNLSNTTIGVTDIDVYDSNHNLFGFIETMNDGSFEAGSFFSAGNWTFIINKTGYSYYNQTITITNGNNNYYLYIQPNTTSGANIHLSLIDASTGQLANEDSLRITPYYYNSTGSWQYAKPDAYATQPYVTTQNGSADLIGYPSSNNYSFTVTSTNKLYQQGTFGDQFVDSGHYSAFGDVNIELTLFKTVNLSFIRPRVLNINFTTRKYTLKRADDSTVKVNGTDVFLKDGTYLTFNGTRYSYTLETFTNPAYICTNQSYTATVESIKADFESYYVTYDATSGGGLRSNSMPIISKGNVKYSSFGDVFSTNGTKLIGAYALSETYSVQSQVFPNSPYIYQTNVTVSDCAGVVFGPDGSIIEFSSASDEVKNDVVGQSVRNFFQDLGPITNMIIFFAAWIIIGGMVGVALVETTKSAQAYLYAFGIVGFFDIAFYTYVYPFLGGFVLFSVVLIGIIMLVFKAKDKAIGGGN